MSVGAVHLRYYSLTHKGGKWKQWGLFRSMLEALWNYSFLRKRGFLYLLEPFSSVCGRPLDMWHHYFFFLKIFSRFVPTSPLNSRHQSYSTYTRSVVSPSCFTAKEASNRWITGLLLTLKCLCFYLRHLHSCHTRRRRYWVLDTKSSSSKCPARVQ